MTDDKGAALKKTPLFEKHVGLGGHIVPFAGWEMPLYYTSILEEHMNVRRSAGLFDVSHMGEVILSGKSCESDLDRLSTNRIAGREIGSCTYTHFLDDRGIIIDDTIAIRTGADEFVIVPNASRTEEILNWVVNNVSCDVSDVSAEVCCIALQGPEAVKTIGAILPDSVPLRSFTGTFSGGQGPFMDRLKNSSFFVSRTGYTGEDGFELFTHASDAPGIWSDILSSDHAATVPAGLGARDSLRLEKGYLLSGTDFDGRQSTLETGYDWVIKWDHDFIGREALEEQKRAGGYSRLICIRVEGRSIPRHGDRFSFDGGTGTVTSGGFSPVLGTPVAMGYAYPVPPVSTKVRIDIRGRTIDGVVVKPPFVR
ncbi:MAG: glycine cleavage system aminomethyltransferase GcvT [Thermoplasmata archaeon]|nr:glycine cleavage system aminomethyltransferase GcvT [Candidatus Sysuiplasma acidicola]MBX8645399.1 glycine cleavage system aminomethyltransferase GcvT [Candidatus Sysuiplasma acidicola]